MYISSPHNLMQHITFLLVESASGLSAKSALNGADFRVIFFRPQDGHALRTLGIQKGRVHTHFTINKSAILDNLISCV